MVMLTGRTNKMDEVVGLEVGADDYPKPSTRAFCARISAHLRRSTFSAPGSGGRAITAAPCRSTTPLGGCASVTTRSRPHDRVNLIAVLAASPSAS
jgi:DNA-binding response OmpR family regulator